VTYSPTVRRRRLSAVLRQLRRQSELHADEVARRLEWTPSKVTRIERNEWRLPSVRDVKDLLDVYQVTDETQRDEILKLAREARQRGWWEEYKDVLGGTVSLPEFEAEARKIHSFEALLIPGLLQTAEYAAGVFRGGKAVDNTLIDRRVEARLTRQTVLDREDPPMLWALIDEAALAKHVGGVEVMRRQIYHIAEMAKRPNIAVQVIPNAVGAHAAMENAFSILEFADPIDPTLVYVETVTGDMYLELPEQVHRYTLAYDHARASALSADATVAYLADLASDLK
jgi:transcriptional regulator with XRE-family HTH domain